MILAGLLVLAAQAGPVTGAGLALKATWEASSVAGVGDIDGDGCDDVVLGHVRAETTVPGAGAIEARSGADGRLLYRVEGWLPYQRIARGLRALGDLDGDGVSEFAALGGYFAGNLNTFPSQFVVCSGATGAPLWYREDPLRNTLMVGIHGVGDQDGDGNGDVLYQFRADGPCILASGLDGREIGRALPRMSLRHVESVDDLDGDGARDVVCLLVDDSWSGGPRPLARIGAVSLRGGTILWQQVSPEPRIACFEFEVVEDRTGDGVQDSIAVLLIAAPGQYSLSHSRLAVLDGTSGAVVELGEPLDFSVSGLQALGDLDGDGTGDLAIYGPQSFRIYTPGRGRIAELPGSSTTPVGDLDGDGRPELLSLGMHTPQEEWEMHVRGWADMILESTPMGALPPSSSTLITLRGATPGGVVGILLATSRSAPSPLTSGPCAGLGLPVIGPLDFWIRRADSQGALHRLLDIPLTLAGSACVLALDLSTCKSSNALTL